MTTTDDRAAFDAERAESIRALAQDARAFSLALDALLAAERHRYSYLWRWLGVPIIQTPADVVALQEVIWDRRPDVIVETGIARGGSMVFFASMMRLLGRGKVIGVDIDIRAHNRDTLSRHPFTQDVVLIEGSSVAEETLARVRAEIPDGAKVMVVLDSDHTYAHVLAELRAYAGLVSPGQSLVVADTVVGHIEPERALTGRARLWHKGDDPLAAVSEFLVEDRRFRPDDEVNGKLIFAASPGGYLIRETDGQPGSESGSGR